MDKYPLPSALVILPVNDPVNDSPELEDISPEFVSNMNTVSQKDSFSGSK